MRTKSACSIPGGPGSDRRFPAAVGRRWHHARLSSGSPDAGKPWRDPLCLASSCWGTIPLPSLAPTSWSANASLPTMDTYEANCFNSTRIQNLFFSTEIRRRRGEKQRTITLSFKQESLPGSTKCFKALSKTHWNEQIPFPFISVDTGGGYNLRHNLKALSVTLSCIINNTTNSRTCTGIPASSYAVTLS